MSEARNFKPTPEQVQEWTTAALNKAPDDAEIEAYDAAVHQEIAKLAAAWGAEQAQQTPRRHSSSIDYAQHQGYLGSAEEWRERCRLYRVRCSRDDVLNMVKLHSYIEDGLLVVQRADAEQAQQTTPEGFVRVPLVMTRAMEEVTQREDWQWADLLAAAEAVTEEQYNMVQAQQTTVEEPELPEAVDLNPSANCVMGYTAAQMQAFADAKVRAAMAQQSQDALGYAQRLAKSIASKEYPEVTQFEVLDDLMGVLSQIDNMTCGMTRVLQGGQQP